MSTPTEEELKAHGLNREQYELRNRIWHRMLAEMEPDERERIQAEPTGQEAMAAALLVEYLVSHGQTVVQMPRS